MGRPANPATVPAGPIATRLVTLEATLFLLVARALIAAVRFGRWRHLLGRPAAAAPGRAGSARAAPLDRYLARATDRAADRLPLQLKCLPRAMALHWMLHRRGRRGELVIAALPRALREGRDDLHAWVEAGGIFLIGQPDNAHRSVVRLSFD